MKYIVAPIYLGILIDTGSFKFNYVKSHMHEVLAKLLEVRVIHHFFHEKLNATDIESRLRLQGYAMSEKLEVLYDRILLLSLYLKKNLRICQFFPQF